MKRIYSFMAAAFTMVAAVSCVQEIVKEDQLHEGAVVYKAFGDGTDTRAVLGTNGAGRPQSMWENGDKITIHNGVKGYEFTTSAEDGSPVADFVYEGDDFTADNGVIAVYPAGDYETSIEDRTIKVTIPYDQYAVDGSYDRNAVPAVAYSMDNSLQFKNASALLKFKVGRSDVSAVSFTSKGGEIVSGTITSTFDSDGESCEFYTGTPWEDGKNFVFLHSPESSNFETGKTYYMSIAPNTFEYGFVIHLDAGETSVFSKEYDQSITINRNTILDLGTLGEGNDQTYSDKLYVVGTYNGWRHEYSTYLYDYSGDNATYEGVVDFNSFGLWAGIENNEFKLTGGDWGIDEHSQSEGDHYGTEPDVLSLVEGAGANINAYQEKRFYHFTFDRASNTLKKNYAFNSVGVIGSFSGWSQDVDMNYNPETQKFWVDIEFAEDSELKFRLDDSWDVSFGADDSVTRAGNENILVSTGQYRVYLNLNNSTEVNYEFNEEAYGTEENAGGVTPWEEPDPVEGWALIGEFNSWNGDELMTETEPGLWVITGFALEAGQQWKLRKDGGWDENYGGPGSEEPYNITIGETFTATYYGVNMAVSTSGVYDIYFDESKETILVLEAGSPLPEPTYLDYVDEYGINHGPGVEINGVVWAPVNCGYHAEDFKYGKLYQWGRKYGQGYVGSFQDAIVPTLKEGPVSLVEGLVAENENVYFGIDSEMHISYWSVGVQSGLWNSGTEQNPIKTEYDPCPEGWRVPTSLESASLESATNSWVNETHPVYAGVYGIIVTDASGIGEVFFPASGYLTNTSYGFDRGRTVTHWSSKYFDGGGAEIGFCYGANLVKYQPSVLGFSVRCVKDESPLIKVESLTIDKTSLNMSQGEVCTISAEVYPADANHSSAIWYSDTPSVATVDKNGKVTAVSVGTARIIAMAGMKSAECVVTVKESPFIGTWKGTMSGHFQQAIYKDVTFTVDADPEGGFIVSAGINPYFYMHGYDQVTYMAMVEGNQLVVYKGQEIGYNDVILIGFNHADPTAATENDHIRFIMNEDGTLSQPYAFGPYTESGGVWYDIYLGGGTFTKEKNSIEDMPEIEL